MFLSKHLRTLRSDQDGSAIMAVLGIMAVTAIIGVTVTAATIQGLSQTSSTRASVQSRAAAEAGVDVAAVGLQTSGSCTSHGGVYESAAVPAYRAVIEYNSGAGWVENCPINTATQVRITSTGGAKSDGVAGASLGDETVVEAVYNYIPDYTTIPTIGAAVYAHTISGILRNFNLDSADNSVAADVQIRNGNVICSNGARIAGNLILGNGFANLSNCRVTKSVHVSQYVTVDGGSIVVQDVLAAGAGVPAADDVVTVRSGSTVEGNVFGGGNVSVLSSSASLVTGNVTVAGSATSRATVARNSEVRGNVLSSGSVANAGTIGGVPSSNVSGLQRPPVPLIPNWTDVPYPSATWATNGYQEVVWPASNCTIDHGNSLWAAISTETVPTVINALACGAAGITTSSTVDELTLQANVAFIAHKFEVNKLYAISSDTAVNRNLWFIVPDNTADSLPTCSSPSGGIYLHNEADIKPSVSAMAYSPCKVKSDRDGWRGQLYGGEVEFGAQAKLTFVPVGIPGVSFAGGLPPVTVLSGGHLGNRVSLRGLG